MEKLTKQGVRDLGQSKRKFLSRVDKVCFHPRKEYHEDHDYLNYDNSWYCPDCEQTGKGI